MFSTRHLVYIVVSSLFVLGGCASKGKANDEPFEPVVQQGIEVTGLVLDTRWRAGFGSKEGLILSFAPMVSGETVCAAGQKQLACFDLKSGDRLWREKRKDLTAGVAIGEGLVVGATASGDVIAWGLEDGAVQWQVNSRSEVTARPAIGRAPDSQPVVVVNTGAGRVIGLSAEDGSELWGHEQQVPSLTLRGNAAPLIHNGYALVGFDNGRLMSISLADGSLRWEAAVGRPEGRTELDRIVDVDSTPVIRRNDVYSTAYNTHTRALDLRTGREVWNKRVSGSAGAAVDKSRLYVSGADSQLYALDVYSGRIIWQLGTFSDEQSQRRYDGILTAPTIYKGYVLVADSEGMLHAVDAESGLRVFSQSVGDNFSAAPQIHENALILQSRSGLLSVIDFAAFQAGDSKSNRSSGFLQ